MSQIKIVETKEDWNAFISLPWQIYQGDANWVPPLKQSVRDTLSVDKNPFFQHATMHPVLALRGGKAVGRVIGVIDDNHNRRHGDSTAFFGFFECVNDQKVANQLLDEVARWASRQGQSQGQTMKRLRGPMNPSTNHECGLLVEGFEHSPSIMMTYNPPYYAKLIESWGLAKAKDLYAYDIDGRKMKFADRLIAQAEKLKQSGQVTFRPIRMREFDQEVERILEIYNDAWEENWGFVPMEPGEFRHMAKEMKSIVDPEIVLLAEVRGEPAAFALTLPDVNQALKKIPDGELFPLGLAKLLWYLKGPGKKTTVNRCRILTLGVKKKFRELGVGPLLYAEYLRRGPANGYPIGEASWILEDNEPMMRALEQMSAQRTKTYRIFERALAPV